MTATGVPHVSPAVTIIATAYNTADFIIEAVESALNQTHRDFELIIVDDASTDSTFGTATQLAESDGRIKVLRHETNKGAGEARNTGLRHATGRYISFLDTDDVWEEQFLDRMSAELDAQGDSCAGVFCSWRMISEEGASLWGGLRSAPGNYDLVRMLEGICPPGNGSTLMIRRECFDEVGEFSTMEVGQDAEMWLRIVAESSRSFFHYVPSCLVRYREREGSLMTCSHETRRASFEYTIDRYLPQVERASRWKVYSAFARRSAFAGPGLDSWRKMMSRKALLEGGFRRVGTKEGWELIAMALFGVRR